MLGGTVPCKVTVVHEVHTENAVQQQSIESNLYGTKPESVPSYRFNDTESNDKLCDVFD